MPDFSYYLVDVFTTNFFAGNQLAVFPNAEGISTVQMQKIARELNISETSFVLPAKNKSNDKKIRIFTPAVELPMAGHPTIGTAYVLASRNLIETNEGATKVVFEENVGDIGVTVHKLNGDVSKVEMEQPIPRFGDIYKDSDKIAKLLSLSAEDIDLSLPIQSVSAGVPFLYVPLNSLSAMKKIKFRLDIWKDHFSAYEDFKHVFVFSREVEHKGSTIHSRMFAPAMGIPEDPATGAASGPLGAYLVHYGVTKENIDGEYQIVSEQGIEMGRASFIDITILKKDDQISSVKIGGCSVDIGEGRLYL